MRRSSRWQEWVSLVAGAWLFVSPWILAFGSGSGAAWNAYIVGALVVLFSIWGISAARSKQTHQTSSGQ